MRRKNESSRSRSEKLDGPFDADVTFAVAQIAGSIISGAALSAIRTLVIDIAPNMYLSHKMQTIYYGMLVDEGWGIFGDVTNHYGVYNESILGL